MSTRLRLLIVSTVAAVIILSCVRMRVDSGGEAPHPGSAKSSTVTTGAQTSAPQTSAPQTASSQNAPSQTRTAPSGSSKSSAASGAGQPGHETGGRAGSTEITLAPENGGASSANAGVHTGQSPAASGSVGGGAQPGPGPGRSPDLSTPVPAAVFGFPTALDYHAVPDDAQIGALANRFASGAAVRTIYRTVSDFLTALSNGKASDNLIIPDSRLFLSRTIALDVANHYVPQSFRIGRISIADNGESATIPVKLFGNPGVATGEVFVEKVGGEWYISGLPIDLSKLATAPPESGQTRIEPSTDAWLMGAP